MTPLQSLALIILITVLTIAISVVTDVAKRPAPVYRCPVCQRRYGDDTVAGCAMCADDPWGEP